MVYTKKPQEDNWNFSDFQNTIKFNAGLGYINLLNTDMLYVAEAYRSDNLLGLCKNLIELKSDIKLNLDNTKTYKVINNQPYTEKAFMDFQMKKAFKLRGEFLLQSTNVNFEDKNFINATNQLALRKNYAQVYFAFEQFLLEWKEELFELMQQHQLINPVQKSLLSQMLEPENW